MWHTIEEILLSRHPLSAIVYLVIGALAGAIISVRYSVKAQRPKLIVSGGGSGGNQHQHHWSISISNRPSFFGQNLDGEPARDVHAHIQVRERNAQSYMAYWEGEQRKDRVTIEPGQQRSLQLFHWNQGTGGYFVVDGNGEPVARFQSREVSFTLRLIDRLERVTEFPFVVEFDDTHLKNAPRLQIMHPLTLRDRVQRIKSGWRFLMSAFRAR